MAHGWFILLLTLGVCGLSSSVPRQFHLVRENKTWAAAQQYCREEFTDLATIDNMADIDEIKRVVQDAGVGSWWRGWIGLWKEEIFMGYFNPENTDAGHQPDWQWSDGSSSSFRHWAPEEPNNFLERLCVMMPPSGLWYDEGCYTGSHMNFVCYEALPTVEVVSPQPPFYSGDDVTLRCDIPRYTGQHQYVWLKDNSPVPGKTNQTITITLPLEAGQYQCHRRRDGSSVAPYISTPLDIEYMVKRTQIVRVEMEMASDVDVEDPDVQKAFLQQIEQRLKAKGLRAVQLSWRKQPDGKVFHKKKNDKKKEKKDEF